MDVYSSRSRAARFIVFGAFIGLSACGKNDKTAVAPEGFREVSSECSSTAVNNQFLVNWKDGSLSIEKATDREEFLEKIMLPYEDEIEFAENDQIVRLHEPEAALTASAENPDDWGQRKISAPVVWADGARGKDVVVAVIDSGADISHPMLKNQLAVNSAEVANDLDDDGNGLVDDINGYDFNTNSGKLDAKGADHGTHVSGIILADHSVSIPSGDKQAHVLGIAPQAKLLPLDFMNEKGAGEISDAIDAINYAASRGAKVINASWGGPLCSETLRRTIADLEAKGVLFVTAAGNDGLDLTRDPEWPAAFKLGGQLTVAATTPRDITAGFSNYSYNLVHLGAPGSLILSALPGERVGLMSGTSMAAPFVSGAAAVLWGLRPNATVRQIREAILLGVDRDPSHPAGVLAVESGGRLNLQKAVAELIKLLP